MKKDAYYFSHDCNARDDPKCVLLIEQLGLEGYGIFWVLIETLREQPDYMYPMALLPALARRYNSTHEKMRAVVAGYDLFQIVDDKFFFSESLKRRMEYVDYKREIARIAGRKSAEIRLLKAVPTDVQRTFNDGSTIKGKESKYISTSQLPNDSSDKQKTFDSGSKPYKAAEYLDKQICSRLTSKNSATEKTLQSWALCFDKLNRIDGQSWENIGDVLSFSQCDSFWQSNILSGKKFREKYFQLLAKMQSTGVGA